MLRVVVYTMSFYLALDATKVLANGACCFSNKGCLELNQSNCAVIPDSRWSGEGTTCIDMNQDGIADTCFTPEPAHASQTRGEGQDDHLLTLRFSPEPAHAAQTQITKSTPMIPPNGAAAAPGKDTQPPAPKKKDADRTKQPKNNSQRDFRKVDWGASIEEVKAAESGPPESETDNSLTYENAKQWGVPGTVLYEFSEDKLIRAVFVTKGSMDFQTIWRQFSELERRLMSSYPKPVVNERRWNGNKPPGWVVVPAGTTLNPIRKPIPGTIYERVQVYDDHPEPADDADLLKYCRDGEISCFVVWKNRRSQVSLEIGTLGCNVKMELSPRVDIP